MPADSARAAAAAIACWRAASLAGPACGYGSIYKAYMITLLPPRARRQRFLGHWFPVAGARSRGNAGPPAVGPGGALTPAATGPRFALFVVRTTVRLPHKTAGQGGAVTFLDEATWRGRIYSGGWQRAAGGEAAVNEPATGAELGRVGVASPADVASATAAAAAAQPAWAALPHTQRSAILRRAGEIWLANAAEIEQWSIREGGKIGPAARFETHVATEEVFEAATLPSRPHGELLPSEQPNLSFTERVPAGVVGVIAPFNFPQILAIRSVAPALALGNAVVLKPDPRTAVCGGVVLARVFEEAGLPEGLLHVLPGGPEVGEALVTDPRVGVISFTGSTAAGRKVGALAGQHLKRVHLELGGNSALSFSTMPMWLWQPRLAPGAPSCTRDRSA